jgi:hypothetical protein
MAQTFEGTEHLQLQSQVFGLPDPENGGTTMLHAFTKSVVVASVSGACRLTPRDQESSVSTRHLIHTAGAEAVAKTI